MKIVFVSSNKVDPDEILLYAAFHLGLYCLAKVCIYESLVYKGLRRIAFFKKDCFFHKFQMFDASYSGTGTKTQYQGLKPMSVFCYFL